MKDIFDEKVEELLGKDAKGAAKDVAGKVNLDSYKSVLTKNLRV